MNNYFVILAAGKGTRFGKKIPKQYYIYNDKEILLHSVHKALKSKLFKKIVIVTDNFKRTNKLNIDKTIKIIKGGNKRFKSSLIALKFLKKYKPNNILIHDAARPNFSIRLLKKLISELKLNNAVIPYLQSKDAIKYKIKNEFYNLDKKRSYLTQTPQAFRFNNLYNISTNNSQIVSDESELFLKKNLSVRFIKGEISNIKITTKEDLKVSKNFFGIGFDVHRLIKGKKLFLGGMPITYHSGLKGHSDGDVILHAIIDAILGATRKKDIGTYFPNTKNKFKNIRSPKMLKPILENLKNNNFIINNLDINLICEQPKVSKIREMILRSLSRLMKLEKDKINLKGKTVEKIGLIGQEKAIACEVIISITKYD